MKTLIQEYIFDPSQRKIKFLCDEEINLKNLSNITNLTKNQVIFASGVKRLGGTIIDNEITLDVNTSNMLSDDILQIYFEKTTNYEKLNSDLIDALAQVVSQLQSLKNSTGMADINKRMRVSIEAGSVGISASQTLGTVTTVGSLTNMGSLSAQAVVQGTTNLPAGNIRNKIIIS